MTCLRRTPVLASALQCAQVDPGLVRTEHAQRQRVLRLTMYASTKLSDSESTSGLRRCTASGELCARGVCSIPEVQASPAFVNSVSASRETIAYISALWCEVDARAEGSFG